MTQVANIQAAAYPMLGGVLLPVTALVAPSPPQSLPLFVDYCVPLSERPGLPAHPLVVPGQTVYRGERIAQQSHPHNAHVHAPTSGRITRLHQSSEHHPVTHIELQADGHDQAAPTLPSSDWTQCSPEHCKERLQQAGIIGLGGAGFPLMSKAHSDAIQPHTLIINAVECDPWQSSDVSVLLNNYEGVLLGVQALCHCWPIQEVFLTIKTAVVEPLAACQAQASSLSAPRPNLLIRTVADQYPSGGERQLVQQLLGQRLQPAQRSSTLGILCCNVQTVLSAGLAIAKEMPLISRVTTLAGGQLNWQGQVILRNGTRARDLLDWAGYQPSSAPVLLQGLMMGSPLTDLAQPLGKTTTALLAPSPTQWPEPASADPCIRCGDCAEVCPEQLKPQELWRTLQANDKPAAAAHQLDACILCGACNTVCPSHIPLVQTFALGQQEWHSHQAQQHRAALAQQRFEQRQHRLAAAEAAQAERRARRAAMAAERRQTAVEVASEHPQNPELQALAERLASAEQKLAKATPGERKAMQMTVRKLQQQLARLQQEGNSDANA